MKAQLYLGHREVCACLRVCPRWRLLFKRTVSQGWAQIISTTAPGCMQTELSSRPTLTAHPVSGVDGLDTKGVAVAPFQSVGTFPDVDQLTVPTTLQTREKKKLREAG